MFANSGTIIFQPSKRPPYTMTNRSLQIDANLEEIEDRQSTGPSIWSHRERVYHALHLFCKREHTASHVAIILRRGIVENEWVRGTDSFFTLSFNAKNEFKYREARYISVKQKNTRNRITSNVHDRGTSSPVLRRWTSFS